MNRRLTRLSKYLTFVLRHHPESIGLHLDDDGSASVEQLIAAAASTGKTITAEQINEVVERQDETRLILRNQGQRIAAV